MCGICGIFGQAEGKLVEGMLDCIKYRGPDSFDTTTKPNFSLGGCRLFIVGDEPRSLIEEYDEARSHVLLNGEIYNYSKLKDDLAATGITFETGSEAEVALKVFQKYGPDGFAKLKGMFALAIIDRSRLILARDSYGIKPLFYYHKNGATVFASELKALLRHPDIQASIDETSLREISTFGFIASEKRTIFKEIVQIAPGTAVVFERKQCAEHVFSTIPKAHYLDICYRDYSEDILSLRKVLSDSVGMMMNHGSQEKGFYLSGGIDSSTLALLAAERTNKPVATFTMADSENSEDFKAARMVANAIGSRHHEFIVGTSDFLSELPSFLFHYETITAGGAFDIYGAMAFHMLSKRVSDYVKVAFSGEGADELFGGYYWTYTHPLGFSDRIKNRARNLQDYEAVADTISQLFPEPEDEFDYRRNLFDFLVGSGLSNYHLWSVDRSCSAFGFEVRPAYLFNDIADLALGLPIEYRCNGKETKVILKSAVAPWFEKYNISSVLNRQKIGMPAAIRGIGENINQLAEKLIPESAIKAHPYKGFLKTPLEVMLFDLFFYIFIENRAINPDGIDVINFFRDDVNARMYA